MELYRPGRSAINKLTSHFFCCSGYLPLIVSAIGRFAHIAQGGVASPDVLDTPLKFCNVYPDMSEELKKEDPPKETPPRESKTSHKNVNEEADREKRIKALEDDKEAFSKKIADEIASLRKPDPVNPPKQDDFSIIGFLQEISILAPKTK
jgi:hypothetical protein